jgi:DnaJ-class molecular chaperone
MSDTACQACKGFGYILVMRRIANRPQAAKQQCAACNGTGQDSWQ